jgi:hypothetical protein
MKTFLLSIFALAIVAAPVMGEDDQDHPKQPKYKPPQRQVNPPPRPVTPRIQSNVAPKQQPQNRPPVTVRTYAPPKSYTPEVQARLRNKVRSTPKYTAPNQDMPRTSTTLKTDPAAANNRNWRNRPRTDTNVAPPQTPTTNVAPSTTARNRDWQNRSNSRATANTNRNWQNRNWQTNTTGYQTYTWDQARRRHHREWHNRSWWSSRYNRISLFGGGYYYWDDGYWFPAYGYDPGYSSYAYDEPIYGYNELPPGQVIANVQSALQEQGYYNDAVDGLIGPNTRVALSNFQRDAGLPVTAAIDGPTLKALGLY